MAFIDQVQDLTSLTISDTGELTQFLTDGVIDVTNRCLAVNPREMETFLRSSSEATSNGTLSNSDGKIVSVVRESGTNDDWRECRKGFIGLQSRYTDTDSLDFASTYNPVYVIGGDGSVLVYPVPSSGGADSYKFYYINATPVNGNDETLTQAHTDINYFPKNKVYLVIMYAGIKSLGSAMGDKSIDTLSINTVPPDPPDAPDISTITVSLQTAGSLGSAPTYTKATQTFDTSQFETFLETDEDAELAQVQLGRLQLELGEYQADITNELNEFNEAHAAYQATVQEALQELDVAARKAEKDTDLQLQKEIQEYTLKLQKYQGEIASYQAEIGSEVQEYTNQLQEAQLEYTWLQEQQKKLIEEYNQAFAFMAGPQSPAKEESK